MNNGSRILHQIMRNREHGRSVRERTMQSTAAPPDPLEDGRPHSALSSYDIGIALRISEPNTPKGTIPRRFSASRETRSRPTTGQGAGRPESAGSQCLGTTDTTGTSAAAPHHPHVGAGSAGRPPSPYRRPATADESSFDAKRAIAQLQSRLSALENQLQQARAQKRLLTIQNRKYRAKLAQVEGDDDGGAGAAGYASDDSRHSSTPANTHVLDAGLRDEMGSPVDIGDDNTLSHGTPSPLPELDEEAARSNAVSIVNGSIDLTAVVGDNDAGLGGAGGSDSASLLELSERQSCASAQQAINVLVDTERVLVEDAMGEPASHKFAFAVEVRSDDDLRELLMEACRKIVSSTQSGCAPRSPPNARSSASQRRAHRSSKGNLKTLLDELKREVVALRASSDKRLGAGVQLCFTLLQQLDVLGDGIASMVSHMDGIKTMLLGRTTDDRSATTVEPVTLSNLGAHVDECLSVVQQLCRHAHVALDVADKNHARLRSTVSPKDGVADDDAASHPGLNRLNGTPQQGMHHHTGHREAPTRVSPTSAAPPLNTPELRISSSIASNVGGLRAMLDTLQRRCHKELQRTLRDAATEEDLLKVYQQEIEAARARCCHGGAKSDACCQTVDLEPSNAFVGSGRRGAPIPLQDSITVPTVSEGSLPSSAVGSPTSRPGSSSRPRSSGGGKQRTPHSHNVSGAIGMPPVIKHLVQCVNALHIAFTEIVFGPVHSNSRFKTIAAQAQERQERHRREAMVLGSLGGGSGSEATCDAGHDSLNDIVLVHRGGGAAKCKEGLAAPGFQLSSGGPSAADSLLDDVATRQLVERHMQTLPNTYGDLLRRDVARITAFPSQLTAQDEADLAANIDMVQQLVEIGLLWHDALQGAVRVHHCSDFLALVRHAKPLVSAYFFHDVSLKEHAISELQDTGASFAEALRGIVMSERRVKPGSAAQNQKKRAQEMLLRVKLLSDASHARAKLNWRGLLVLHKHMRMKQLLLAALRQQQGHATGVGDADAGDNLRRMVAAFYADQTIKLAAEQRLLRSSLHITLVAVWTELLTLLRDSSDMCLACGLNVEVLDVLGPAHADLIVSANRQLAEVLAKRNVHRTGGGDGHAHSISIPERNVRIAQAATCDTSTKRAIDERALPASQSVGSGMGGVSPAVVRADAWLGLQISSSVVSAPRPASSSPILAGAIPAHQAEGKRLHSAASTSLKPLRPHGKGIDTLQHRKTSEQRELFFLAPQEGAVPRKVYTRTEVLAAENPWLNKT